MTASAAKQSATISRRYIEDVLDTVQDPELPLSVRDLGMVYDIRIDGSSVSVDIGLTSTGCPMHDQIVDDVRAALHAAEGVEDVVVTLVWDPPWTHERITPQGREALASWGVST